MPDWIDAFYADVEGMRLQEPLDHFAPDGEMVFANNPPAAGHAAITELPTGFWSAIAAMRHDWRHRWAVDQGTLVLEARVHYTTHGGHRGSRSLRHDHRPRLLRPDHLAARALGRRTGFRRDRHRVERPADVAKSAES